MRLLNPDKAAEFMDSVQGMRQRSAVLAIHLTWLDHSSPLAREKRIDPKTPLDLTILYAAAAATFQDWPPPTPPEELGPVGRVMNHERAAQRLASLPDDETRLLATAFACHVIRLSAAAETEQDLDYYLQLFMKCIGNATMIENIMSGAVSRNSEDLADPDLW
jgi:hypothetical protein